MSISSLTHTDRQSTGCCHDRVVCYLLAALPFLVFCVSSLVTQPLQAAPNQAAAQPPNIVFILIDDLGWMDLACQGNKLVETPNVDRFAKQGMRFTDAYAAAPVCSPTRAAILTGLSPARVQLTNHLPDQARFTPKNAKLASAKMLDHLPSEHVTIAERLKEAGYATAFMGKWHLSGRHAQPALGRGKAEFYPERQGFDINIGGCSLGGPPSFFDPYRIHNLPDRKPGEYLPDRLADEAIRFMRAKQQKPFMLFLWNYTVHWPMQAPEPLLKKYESRKGPGLNDTRYGAMIEAMDRSMGRVLAELDALKLSDHTLVVFTSDNGGFSGVADNRPLRLGKGWLYEGGIRVPLMIRWPGVVEPGTLCDTPVISMDFYPTLLAAAGLKLDNSIPIEGESLMPLLTQKGSLTRKAIYFHYPNYAWHQANRLGSAIREEQFKLIENFDDGSVELYDLKNDLSEKRDLAKQMPGKAADLRQKLAAWRKTVGASLPAKR